MALALSLLLSPLVRAGGAAAQAEAYTAEALFDQGRKLMASKQYEQACTKFSASHRLDPAIGTLLNLGYCWKQLGKAASAWTAYREAASLALWQHQSEREAFARAEAAELETRLARLSIHVEDADHPGLELRRNGVPVPRDVWDVEVPVDPGEYTIEAVAPDRNRFATRISVQAAAVAAVNVPSLSPLPESSAAAPLAPAPSTVSEPAAPVQAPERAGEPFPAAPAPQRAETSSVLPALSIGAGAASLVAFGVAAFFALRMESEDEAARGICTDPLAACSAIEVTRHEQRKEAARDSRTAALVSAGVGVACALTAIGLLIAAPPQPAASALAAPNGVMVGVAPGELTIVARGAL